MTEIQQTTDLAREVAAANPGRRVAVSTTGSGIAMFEPAENRFVPIIERTIMGTFVYGGVNTPGRQWVELAKEAA